MIIEDWEREFQKDFIYLHEDEQIDIDRAIVEIKEKYELPEMETISG